MSYPSSHSQRAYRKTQYQQLWWLSSKKQSNCSKAYYYIGKWEWEGDCDQTMHLLRGNLIVILPVCLLSFPLLPFSVTLLQKKKRKKKKCPEHSGSAASHRAVTLKTGQRWLFQLPHSQTREAVLSVYVWRQSGRGREKTENELSLQYASVRPGWLRIFSLFKFLKNEKIATS